MNIQIDKELIQKSQFQYYTIINTLDKEIALDIQEEILNIPDKDWDRYDNPFEQKFTLYSFLNVMIIHCMVIQQKLLFQMMKKEFY